MVWLRLRFRLRGLVSQYLSLLNALWAVSKRLRGLVSQYLFLLSALWAVRKRPGVLWAIHLSLSNVWSHEQDPCEPSLSHVCFELRDWFAELLLGSGAASTLKRLMLLPVNTYLPRGLRRWYITIPSSYQWCTTIENHRYQWLSKTIGKPLIPMVALNYSIQW